MLKTVIQSGNRKNVCLVTWQGSGNYGTCLQSFALHWKLQMLGYNVSFLHPFHEPFSLKSYLFDFALKTGLFQLLRKIKYSKNLKMQKTYRYQHQGYNMVYVNNINQKEYLLSDMDVFITGSDQIWNTYHFFDSFFFLDFAGDKKRIAYASSIGTKDIKRNCCNEVKRMLERFAHIGVREESAMNALKILLPKKEIIQVLDPTFLLTINEWKSQGQKAKIEIAVPNNYIFCYFIGNRKEYAQQLADVKQSYDIPNVILIPSLENPNIDIAGVTVYDAAGPLEFVYLLLNASLVCTDSFHATALSINGGKDFVEFIRFDDDDKQSQNSRIYDVLEHYGLRNRIYSKKNDSWTKYIDYSAVSNILNSDREKSISYLLNSIEN